MNAHGRHRLKARAAIAVLLVLVAGSAFGQGPISGRSLGEVIEMVAHPNPAVRVQAVSELGRRGESKALVTLLGALSDVEAAVRAHAAEALRGLGDERAVPRLAKALEDPDTTVRARAALSLGELGGKYVLPTLTRYLKDPEGVVRAAVIRALGEIGDPLSVDAILSAQRAEKEDPDFAVTAAALISTAKLGGPTGLAASLGHAGKKLEASWFVRAAAAHAVGLAADRERIPLLTGYLQEDDDPRVCQAAAGALGTLGARDALLAGAALEAPFRRRAAVAGLSGLEGAEIEAALVLATRDEDPGVVLEASAALLSRGKAEAFPILISLLEGDASVWLGALEALEGRSGQTFGRNPPRWTAWFAKHRDKLSLNPDTGTYEPKK